MGGVETRARADAAIDPICQIHLIVDEIYALSTFDTPDQPDAQPFVSILSIDPQSVGCHPGRVHAVYGASKVSPPSLEIPRSLCATDST